MRTDFCVTTKAMAEPAVGCTVEVERLGDEIAVLSAHLDAATAHLLDLIREFDARRLEHRLPLVCRVAVVAGRARPRRGPRACSRRARPRHAAEVGAGA